MSVLKIVIMGRKSVGTSTLLNNYTNNIFSDQERELTIGVGFFTKEFSYNKKIYKVQIWKLMPYDRFRFLIHRYIAGAHGAAIIYDMTDSFSLQSIPEWIQMIRGKMRNITIMLLGNKVDLINRRQVSKNEVDYLLGRYNIQLFYEISALKGINVESAFNEFFHKILERVRRFD